MNQTDARPQPKSYPTTEVPARRLIRRDAVWIALLAAIWIGAFTLQGLHIQL